MSALANNYKRRKISFKYGKGSFLFSTKGKKYLDFVQGIAVNSLGHSNSYLTQKLKKQANKLWHVSNAFKIPEGEKLAKRLTKNTFADAVIFQTVEPKLQRQQLNLQDVFFIPLESLIRIKLFVSKIHFMEEP